jgi:hypothetical protein
MLHDIEGNRRDSLGGTQVLSQGHGACEPILPAPFCVINKQWAKPEQQIEQVMQATVGMYGDLQGIAGKSLKEIEGLEMKALDAPASDTVEG